MTVVTATYRFSGVGEDFGPRADGMVTLHTTEPSDPLKTTVRDGLALARWQDADSVAGSYNRLICSDGVVSTVPDGNASGGINPASAGFKPRAWLYDAMDADEVRNPNYFTLNLSAMGRRAYFDANGWPDRIIDGFARSILEEEARIGRKVVVTQHADFQPPPTRSDAGDIATALVKARYAELTAPEDDMPTPLREYVPELWTAGPSGVDLREQIDGPVIAKIAAGTPVFTVGQSTDGRSRDVVAQEPGGTKQRLYFAARAQLVPRVQGRDPLLIEGIDTVVGLRLDGKPVTFGDAGLAAKYDALVAAVKALPVG